MRKLYMGAIAGTNEDAGQFFFSTDTRSYFNDTPSNWQAFEIEPSKRHFMRNTKKGHRLQGQVREIFNHGERIGTPIADFEGMTARAIEKELNEPTPDQVQASNVERAYANHAKVYG